MKQIKLLLIIGLLFIPASTSLFCAQDSTSKEQEEKKKKYHRLAQDFPVETAIITGDVEKLDTILKATKPIYNIHVPEGEKPVATQVFTFDIDEPIKESDKETTLTPLMMAAQWGDEEIINRILDRGADINKTSQNGQTALHKAVLKKNLVAINILATRALHVNPDIGGANYINMQDIDGNTPIMLIAEAPRSYEKYLKAAQELIALGADVNKPDKYGTTPLMAAAVRNNIPLIQLLVQAGHADMNAVDIDKQNAYQNVLYEYRIKIGEAQSEDIKKKIKEETRQTLHVLRELAAAHTQSERRHGDILEEGEKIEREEQRKAKNALEEARAARQAKIPLEYAQ